MNPKNTSMRLTAYTQAQIERLCTEHGLTQTAVLTLAIERMAAQTLGEHGERDPMVSHYQAKEQKKE
jgi:hypothetical protein